MNIIAKCITLVILNASNQPFTSDPRDLKSLARAKHVCATDSRYRDQPCLKKFLKKENGIYWAICAEKELI